MFRNLKPRVFPLVALVMFTLITVSGCAENPFYPSSSEIDQADMGQVSTTVNNFEDIELPVEMKFDTSKSIVIRTDSFKGGVLHYTGRVELVSLKNFIITTMGNRQWKLVGEAQYESIVMAFTKQNKTCMVVLDETIGGSLGNTTATLYVTVDQAAAM